MKKCKVIYVLLILWVVPVKMYSQSDYMAQINSIFNIPEWKVTTGVLIDRSPAIVNMKGYNGDSVAVCDTRQWLSVFYRLYASHLNLANFHYNINLISYYPLEYGSNMQIPMGIMYYRYDKIKPNAVQDGLLAVDTINNQIIDISGNNNTPLEIDECFAFSPMADTVLLGRTNRFYFEESLFVSNISKACRDIQINFGDGNGFISMGEHDIVDVIYNTEGEHKIEIKATLDNGFSRSAFAKIFVKEIKSVSSSEVKPDSEPKKYYDNGILAYYGIWYGFDNGKKLKNPILIAAGFDPSDEIRIDNEEDNGGDDYKYLYDVANKASYTFPDGMLYQLRKEGYDIIVYRSANSTKSVIDNGKNLASFIKEKILSEIGSEGNLIVIGASMGGLTARYALTSMGQEHQTSLFISMDSPQLGANVPLGFQYMVKYLTDHLGNAVRYIKTQKEESLDSEAALEMLIYHYWGTQGQIAHCASDRNVYLNNLASIGNFPQNCTTMAISMGSGTGVGQGFSNGATLMQLNPTSIFNLLAFGGTLDILTTLLGLNSSQIVDGLNLEFVVNALPDNTLKDVYKEGLFAYYCIPVVKVHYKWWWALAGIPPIVTITLDCNHSLNLAANTHAVKNTQPLDNAPGSFKRWHNLKDFKDVSNYVPVVEMFRNSRIDPNNDCFIPSFSALSLWESSKVTAHMDIKKYLRNSIDVVALTDNLFRNSGRKVVSPFDYLYIEDKNNFHIFDDNAQGVMSDDMLVAMYDLIHANSNNYSGVLSGIGQIINLSPVPATNYIDVQYNLTNNVNNGEFHIIDLMSQNLSKFSLSGITSGFWQQNISLAGFHSGMYIIKFIVNNTVIDSKIFTVH